MQLADKNFLNLVIRFWGLAILAALTFSPSLSFAASGDEYCQAECRRLGYTDAQYTTCAAPYTTGVDRLVDKMEAANVCRRVENVDIECREGELEGNCICGIAVDTAPCNYAAGDKCGRDGRCERSQYNSPANDPDSQNPSSDPTVSAPTSAATTPTSKDTKPTIYNDPDNNNRTTIDVTPSGWEKSPQNSGKSGASCSESPQEGWGPFTYKGSIVPCGRKCNDPATPQDESKDCTICHMLLVVQNIFSLLKSLLFIVAILMITIGGVVYIVSAGNASMKSMAKGLITNTLKGFAIFLLSWLIVTTILGAIAYNSRVFNANGLFSYTCDATSAFESGKLTGSGDKPAGADSQPYVPGQPGSCNGISNNVSDQCKMASPELSDLMACMKNANVPGMVTSISARNVGDNFDKAKNCCGDASCTHSTQTCHYGCTTSQKGSSHAMDIDIQGLSEAQICQIANTAKICKDKNDQPLGGQIWGPTNMCGGNVTGYKGHEKHLHVSTRACNH